MKELTIEEKAKAYDEALKKLRTMRDAWNNLETDFPPKDVVRDIEYYFPELKESEDERIRKELIAIYSVGAKVNAKTGDIPDRDIVAWLEKQGETFTKKDIDDAYLKGVCDAKHELENQGGQKPIIEMKSPEESLGISSKEYNEIVNEFLYDESKSADKVEPKFHEGEWITIKQ